MPAGPTSAAETWPSTPAESWRRKVSITSERERQRLLAVSSPHLASSASSSPNALRSRAWKAADTSAAIRSRLVRALISWQQHAGSPHTVSRRPPSLRQPHAGQLVAIRWSVGVAPAPGARDGAVLAREDL